MQAMVFQDGYMQCFAAFKIMAHFKINIFQKPNKNTCEMEFDGQSAFLCWEDLLRRLLSEDLICSQCFMWKRVQTLLIF